jgi:hypothetical protein
MMTTLLFRWYFKEPVSTEKMRTLSSHTFNIPLLEFHTNIPPHKWPNPVEKRHAIRACSRPICDMPCHPSDTPWNLNDYTEISILHPALQNFERSVKTRIKRGTATYRYYCRLTMISAGGLLIAGTIQTTSEGKSPCSPVRSLRPEHQLPLRPASPRLLGSSTTKSPLLNCK